MGYFGLLWRTNHIEPMLVRVRFPLCLQNSGEPWVRGDEVGPELAE